MRNTTIKQLKHKRIENQIAIHDGRPAARMDTNALFCSCDLDLDPMTLIYELDLDVLTMYLCTKNERSMSRLSTVGPSQFTDKHIDATENTTTSRRIR